MLRNLAAALALMLLSQTALGLGLGTLKQSSALNEPFDGRIEILGAAARDFDTISAKLADSEQFERAGVHRDAVLLQLKFKIVESTGTTDYIQISSHEPIREPFLNFLLELNWANGRMVREYTVLLDPPLYDPVRRPVAAAPAPVQPTPSVTPDPAPEPAAETVVVETAPIAPVAAPESGASYSASGTFGPVEVNDTLWSIASANLPDDSVSIQQMMLALLRTNPEAFGNDNINILKRGAILRMPERSEVDALSRVDAIEEVKRQHQLWSGYRDIATESVADQPLGADTGAEMESMADEDVEVPSAPVDAGDEVTAEEETDDARLELVTPSVEDEQMGAGAADDGDATLAREELDAQVQENVELQARISEANEIIELMQRQVDIKDDELAALQARLAELGIEVPPEVAAELETRDAAEDLADAEELTDEMPADDTGIGDVDITIGEVADVEPIPPDIAEVPDADQEDGVPAVDEGGGVAPDGGGSLLGSLVPEQIANMVPGGAMTVLGVAGAVVLAILALLFKLIRSRRDADADDLGAIAAAASEEDMTSLTEGLDEDDEPITETRDEEAEAAEAGDVTEVAPESLETTPDFQQTMESTAADLQPEETEDDPLEEVNVYLAYERFDQAEELVRKVIGEHPDEHKYKLLLLEVFYSSNNQADYEDAARTLHDAVGDSDPLWESAVAMWTEMSPGRALFEEGAAEAAPAAAGDEAKAFVDITAEEEDDAGASTMSMAPGSDTVLESTQVSLGGATDDLDDSGSLDFDLGDTQGDAAEEGILDLTATTDETGDDEVLDLTATTDDEGILDLTAGMDDTVGGEDDILDLTAGMEESPSEPSDVLDVGAEGELTAGDNILDLTAPDDDGSHDLLDVTKTGDLTGGTDDLLNVTSPGLLDDQEPAADEEPVLEADDGGGIDFDISDTVSPAFDTDEVELVEDETFDLTTPTDEAADEGEDILDFDIGDLEDTAESLDAADETLDISSGLDFDSDIDETVGEDLGLDILEEETGESEEGISTVEMDAVEDDQANIETVPLESTAPSEEEEVGFDLSLQSSELDELSIGGDTIAEPEAEAEAPAGTESEIEFDLALQDTTEMSDLAIDDTLELPKPDATAESLEDLAKSMEESMADLDLEDDDLPETDDEFDLSLADTSGGLDLDFSDTAADGADSDTGVDFDLEGLDLEADTVAMDLSPEEADGSAGTERTVVMPVDDDAEQQSDTDEVDTKLNLAKAYIELGDNDGARSILDEVVRDGSEDQQTEAQRLIEQLG